MTSERPCPYSDVGDTWSGLSRLAAQAAQVLAVSGQIAGTERGGHDGAARDGATRDGAARDGAARDGAARDEESTLRDSMQAELGGLRAAIDYVIRQNNLDWDAVNRQRDRKRAFYERGARESRARADRNR